MRIAQVAPLFESVPPKLYGGTERIVHYLTEELVQLGHDVTLYASGDSQTSARLIRANARSLRLDESTVDEVAHHVKLVDQVAREHQQYDVIHFHIDYLHFPVSRLLGYPQLTTLHGRLDIPDLQPLYEQFSDMPVVSISDAQRAPLAQARFIGTVLHGLPLDLLPFTADPGDYLLFMGRISPEKRPDRAVAIARELNMPLCVAAKIAKHDREYFEGEIAPLFQDPRVTFLGEVPDSAKATLVGGARVLLFPIDWPEPFGLVMIEAMACGTPVVAFDHGSVREVLEDGVTGFIVQDMRQAMAATRQALALDRRRIRETFERRFSARRMAEQYLHLYKKVAKRGSRRLERGAA